MRWVFLLLMMLNAFYYVWHLQQAPLRAKEVIALSPIKGEQRDIRLLHERQDAAGTDNASVPATCLFLGGEITQKDAKTIEQRLLSLDVESTVSKRQDVAGIHYGVKIHPQSRRLIDEALLATLKQDFPVLKSEIISCEGIATSN